MRVIFINLHCNDFYVRTMISLLTGKKTPCRHRRLLDEFIKNGISVVNLITIKGTTLYHRYNLVHRILNNITIYKKEAEYVFRQNKLSGIENITDEKDLHLVDDDLIIYYEHYLSGYQDYVLQKGIKIVDLSHFYGAKRLALAVKRINPDYLVSEIRLDLYSDLYKKNYSWFGGELIVRPFEYEERFVDKKTFYDRKARLCVMGTIADLTVESEVHLDYISNYHTRYMQPQRKMMYDYQNKMKDIMDCYSYLFDEAVMDKKATVADTDLWFKREWIFWYNYFEANKFPSYYSAFDMVDKYNEYQLFSCGEDANGIYAIGAIEGMACGTAYIGLDYGAYNELGLKSGRDFIGYDGTMEDFEKKVRYYLEPEQKEMLSQIARNGKEIIRSQFSEENVAKNYYERLRKIYEDKNNA